jgi:hypothetical protein
MELSELQSPPVPATLERDGKVLINMMVDADLLTPDFLNGIAEVSKVTNEVETVAATASQVNFFVGVLTQAIKAWDLTDKGVPVSINETFFRGQPVRLLTDLFESCLSAGTEDKKKREPQLEGSTSPAVG